MKGSLCKEMYNRWWCLNEVSRRFMLLLFFGLSFEFYFFSITCLWMAIGIVCWCLKSGCFSLKKHSLYELVLSWAQVTMPCCVAAECLPKFIEKSVMSESFVFSLETRSLTQFSIACSWCPWRNICFITWIGLVSSMQLPAAIQPCCVVLQLHVLKLLRKQFVFCPVRLDPWLNSR